MKDTKRITSISMFVGLVVVLQIIATFINFGGFPITLTLVPIIVGGAMRAVLESVGVKDVIAKSKGSSNAHNLVKATIKALAQMRDAYTIAGERGVSMDKVFNG